jgi:hypothetical protein
MLMPLSEMHTLFKHLLDKQSNFSAPETTPEEIDIYLNLSYDGLLKALTKEGIEKTQDWVDYTRNITKSYTFVPVSNSSNKPNGAFVTLPSDHRLTLLEEAEVEFTGCNDELETKRIPVVPVTRDQYSKKIKDPFSKPWKEELLKLSNEGGVIELIGFTGATIKKYFLDYIIEPEAIRYGTQYQPATTDVLCLLEKKAARQLVYMAVNEALKTLGDQRISLVQYDPLIKTI